VKFLLPVASSSTSATTFCPFSAPAGDEKPESISVVDHWLARLSGLFKQLVIGIIYRYFAIILAKTDKIRFII